MKPIECSRTTNPLMGSMFYPLFQLMERKLFKYTFHKKREKVSPHLGALNKHLRLAVHSLSMYPLANLSLDLFLN